MSEFNLNFGGKYIQFVQTTAMVFYALLNTKGDDIDHKQASIKGVIAVMETTSPFILMITNFFVSWLFKSLDPFQWELPIWEFTT